jgi:hypothetical protein
MEGGVVSHVAFHSRPAWTAAPSCRTVKTLLLQRFRFDSRKAMIAIDQSSSGFDGTTTA